MSLSMYQASIPVFIRMLGNLKNIMQKGEEFSREKKIDETVLVNARLSPDMYPLSRQIQIACDMARRCGERLAGMEITSVEDNEKTFSELCKRIETTVKFLETLKAEQIDGTDEKSISLELPNGMKLEFTGMTFLLNFVFPNIYFHITTAYDILRHNGVVLGKLDYIGGPP